jgi:NADPH-dependent 2,4-dienoyl-CoA reductase/sulfur reductase-like enzyme
MTAASQARRRLGPDELEIVVLERGTATSYSACGIPYWLGGEVSSRDQLIARTPDEHAKRGIDVRLRTEATRIDLAAKTVHWRSDAGEGTEPYDDLVYAIGAVPVRPDVPGIDAEGVHGLQTLDDGSALLHALQKEVERVVVVGAGYIGLEVAEACRHRGLEVTVVDQAETPVRTFDPDVGAFLAEAVRGEGIDLVLGDGVAEIVTTDGRARGVVTRSGRLLPADLVVLGLGVRPNTALAEAAGLPLGPSGGLRVDRRMRTPEPHVWAAGDCVESVHRVSGKPVVVALGTHANKQGRVAGINLGGGYATFPGVLGTAITKICDVEVARTGLSSHEADEAGFSYVSVVADSTTTAGYMPHAEPVRLKVLAERGSGRLLGAQIVGRAGAAKRIDALAIAIWNGMAVEEVLGLDLAYAPPFSPVWDPVLVAARKAQDALGRSGDLPPM